MLGEDYIHQVAFMVLFTYIGYTGIVLVVFFVF